MAASYSLHKRILPKLLFDDSTIDDISNLPCVKKGPSVIILSSSKNSKSKKSGNKFIAIGRCFHVSKRTTSESSATSNAGPDNNVNSADESQKSQQQQQHDAANTNVIVRKKLTNVINRVKMDRERDKLKEERSRTSAGSKEGGSGSRTALGAGNRRKLNIASVKSVGRTLYVPTTVGNNQDSQTQSNKDISSNTADTITSTTRITPQKLQIGRTANENNLLDTSSIIAAGGGCSSGDGLTSRGVKFNDNVNNNNSDVTTLQRQSARNTVAVSSGSRPARMAKSLAQIEHPLPYANMEESELSMFQMTRRRVYRFVMSPWFELAVTIFILLNTVFLAIEHHNMNKNIKMVLAVSNHVSVLQ